VIFVGLLFTGALSRTASKALEDEYNLVYTELTETIRPRNRKEPVLSSLIVKWIKWVGL
jgi:hypothetical protein